MSAPNPDNLPTVWEIPGVRDLTRSVFTQSLALVLEAVRPDIPVVDRSLMVFRAVEDGIDHVDRRMAR